MKFSLNRISIKLLVMSLSFTLPIAVMLSLMVKAKQKDINFAVWEAKGNEYQRPLERLFKNVSLHRWAKLRQLHGDTSVTSELTALENNIDSELNILAAVNARLAEDLQFTADGLGKRNRQEFTVENLQKKWNSTKTLSPTVPVEESEQNHKNIINHLKTMITHSGDTSNLILDPDLDSYYLMDVSLLALPQTQDRLQEIASFMERMVKKGGSMSQEERLQASVFAAFLRESDLDRINGSSQTSLNEDQNFYGISETLQKNLSAGMKANAAATEPVISSLKEFAARKNLNKFDMVQLRAQLQKAIETSFAYHASAFDELDSLINKRISVFDADVRSAIAWTATSLILSAILAFLITASIVRRVKKFNETTKVIAGGNLKARVNMKSSDEIGQLASSFDSMTARIENLNAEIAAKNEDLKSINSNLEGIVAERTATIKTILDNVKFGFLLIDQNLEIQEGFSRSCQELLGHNLKAGTPFLDALGFSETRTGPLVREFLAQGFEDLLPEEMTLHQIPSRVQLGERILSLISCCVRGENGKVNSILFTIIDSTNLEKVERENIRHKVLVRLLKEIDSFKDFLEDTKSRLVFCRSFVKGNDQPKLRGELHTLKGNTAAYDMIDIAKLIHHIEDAATISMADIDRIEAAFIGFLEQNFDVLQLSWSSEALDSYAVSRLDLESLVERVKSSAGTDPRAVEELTQWATSIQYKSARSLIGALPDYGERLAGRLGKQIKVRVEGGDTKMDPEVMRPIMQSLVHLVRNAIDHGIELPQFRSSKSEEGLVNLTCGETTSHWQLIVKDDGKGIDTELITKKALQNGTLSSDKAALMTDKEKCRLVFLSGVSTAETVSDISGRGVGMSAVEASVKEAGGTLDIESWPGKGTTVSISVPKERKIMVNKPKRAAA